MKCGECGNTMPPCDGFPKQVFCKRFHLHMGVYEDASRCRDFEPKPQTNADRIRAMTDEELAELLWNRSIQIVEKAAEVVGFSFKCDREKCLSNVLDWLKQETE